MFDHRDSDSILDASTRIEVFQLGENGGFETLRDLVQPDERRVSDDI